MADIFYREMTPDDTATSALIYRMLWYGYSPAPVPPKHREKESLKSISMSRFEDEMRKQSQSEKNNYGEKLLIRKAWKYTGS